ncbi:hypothetical protein [Azohydromonas sp.]|uniref:hypothetical protein n=1 Tax=Azohydromonas sp. TaxID=1872666 RepID=UPI002B88E246|nr:hypothetical protein [Azohydromonas sp.]HMM85345.1 hypothetical protein [Azohydromonas sp.]
MANPTAKIRLLRNVWIGGKPHRTGDVVAVDLEDALACAEQMAGTFIDDDDRERALAARRADIARMLRVTTPWHQAGPSGAWQRTH